MGSVLYMLVAAFSLAVLMLLAIKLAVALGRGVGRRTVSAVLVVAGILAVLWGMRAAGVHVPVPPLPARLNPFVSSAHIPPPSRTTVTVDSPGVRCAARAPEAEVDALTIGLADEGGGTGGDSIHTVELAKTCSGEFIVQADGESRVVVEAPAPLRRLDGRKALPGFAGTVLLAGAILVLLYLGYIFLDAGTRGQFTWQLRIISVLAFIGFCAAIVALRRGL